MQDGGYISPGSTMPAPGAGFGGPSFFQSSIGAAGYGLPLGQGVANFVGGTLPGLAMTGMMLGGMAAPLMIAGGGLRTRALGHAFMAADPFNWAFGAGRYGWRAGAGVGRLAAGALGAGGGGLGAAGIAGGVMGAAAAAAVPLAIGAGIYGVGSYALSNFTQGAQSLTSAQSLMAQMGPSATGSAFTARDIRGSGMALSNDLNRAAHDLRIEPEQVGEIAKFLDSQKFFQTTGNLQEFRAKFKEALATIKKVSQDLQTSIEDAAQTVAQVRQQGFYSTVDIQGQSLRQAGLASATGRSVSEVTGMGLYGAQMARAHGMRGRFGAQFAQNVQASIDIGLRNGSVSEELVNEMGGSEAVAGRLTDLQMRFLSGARGRMMIANALGSNGEIDAGRVSRLLGGNMSLEGMVDGAVNRGLGTLYYSGTGAARQQFMQFAGMAMVNTAMSQRQMLGMSTDFNGLTRGLMHMGASRDEARLLLQQTSQLGRVLDEQGAGETLASQRGQFEALRREYGLVSQIRNSMYENFGNPMQRAGARLSTEVQGAYAHASSWWTGYREYAGGDDLDDVRRGLRSGLRSLDDLRVSERSRGPFSVPSQQERFRDRYQDYLVPASQARGRADLMDAGGGMYVPRDVVRTEEQALKNRFSADDAARMANLAATGSLLDYGAIPFEAYARKKATGLPGSLGMVELSPTAEGAVFGALASLPDGSPSKPSLTWEQWKGLAPGERRKYYGAMADALKGVDSDEARMIRDAIGETGQVGFTNLDSAEEKFRGSMDSFLSDLGMWSWGGSRDEIVESMATNGRTRSSVTDLMQAIASGDEKAIQKARARLDELSDDDKTGALEILGLAQARGPEGDRVRQKIREKFGEGGDLLNLVGGYAAARKVGVSAQMSASAWSKLSTVERTEMFGGLETLAGDIAAAGRQGRLADYQAGWSDLVTKMAAGGVSAQEAAAMLKLSGGQRGAAALARNVNDVLSTDQTKQRAALENFGITGAEADSLLQDQAGRSGDARTSFLMQKLASAGVLSPDAFAGGTTKTIADTEADAWERQTQFVLAVDSFLARFGKTSLGQQIGVGGMEGADDPYGESAL